MPPSRIPPYDPTAYWSTRLASDAGLESVGWQGLGRHFNEWLYRQRRRVLLRTINFYDLGRRSPRVLELGPGNGFYVDLWSQLGVCELTGIDIAEPAVLRLRQRFPAYHFETGDIGAGIDLPPERFDIVTAFDVLFHITSDKEFDVALSVIAGALRPGGMALVTDLFRHDMPVRLPHQHSRTVSNYRERLIRHGMRLERRWPVFVLMHPWADTRSPLARWLGRAWWVFVQQTVARVPGAGMLLGAGLYAIDSVLTAMLRDGPSMELWVLRKVR